MIVMYLTRISTVVFVATLQALEAASDEGCTTVDNKQCIFPFKHEAEGPDLYECTLSGGYSRSKAWCATSVNTDKTYDNWDYCKDDYCRFCPRGQYNVGSVSCGKHNAASCSKCPCREGKYFGESLYNSGIKKVLLSHNIIQHKKLLSWDPGR